VYGVPGGPSLESLVSRQIKTANMPGRLRMLDTMRDILEEWEDLDRVIDAKDQTAKLPWRHKRLSKLLTLEKDLTEGQVTDEQMERVLGDVVEVFSSCWRAEDVNESASSVDATRAAAARVWLSKQQVGEGVSGGCKRRRE
jgi:nitrate/nitrite-specific signal transduction histidine kinase